MPRLTPITPVVSRGTPTLHWLDTRLFVNAGLAYPACCVDDGPLDLDACQLPVTGTKELVTCPHCRTRIVAHAFKALS